MRRRRRSLKPLKKEIKKPSTLSEMMKIALLVHEDGLIWVFHDKAIPDGLDWVDYDAIEDKIYFINRRGIPYDLGLMMKPKLKQDLMNCEYLMAAHVENDDVQNMVLAPFIVRDISVESDEEEVKTK